MGTNHNFDSELGSQELRWLMVGYRKWTGSVHPTTSWTVQTLIGSHPHHTHPHHPSPGPHRRNWIACKQPYAGQWPPVKGIWYIQRFSYSGVDGFRWHCCNNIPIKHVIIFLPAYLKPFSNPHPEWRDRGSARAHGIFGPDRAKQWEGLATHGKSIYFIVFWHFWALHDS